ncbi:guanylate-binding protein 1-like [Panicum miliaceum]|uniref:Guanylate-binding protein 1-like n=1 Tax=Panicum miliaceum TaxID=4540 RepID=A0A3L6R9T8_PANMI|nr:guanylate-binding protein 1-like [Panicum miliaceum]
MLQMLGLRGGAGGGSPSAGDATPARNGDGGAAAGPARPLRLVYCDEKGKFVMDPEAVAALQLVKGPVGVVSVCGRARQGKSFVLNQGTYSIQIFSLAVLLSSMFIYNQMGGIDEAALDRLSLVTEMTKHIRVRASGGRSTASELGQFSPVFVWLLRDFYLDLTEDNRKITPHDYLELVLRPVQGGGRDVSAKNAIRESIRALFPDRECFTLVRPVNNEKDLQRLDQLPLSNFRPEFRSGLDAFTKFVLDRTRPKQLGASTMTGPILAGLTQSFLDAINSGAVPTISSSWQNVEETECRRAYDSAVDTYNSCFDPKKQIEEDSLREAHEDAMRKATSAFNASAVGVGSRSKFEKLLHSSLRKAFEDYKRNAFLEADLQCSNRVQSMESKVRAACNRPDAKLDDVVRLLDGLLTEYESTAYGPGKWKKLATFLQQCLAGPVLDLFRRRLEHIDAERNALRLKCNSSDDKLALLRKQLEASEGHRAEYLRRYEEVINDKQKISKDYSVRITELQTKSSKLEERCMSLSSSLETAKRESNDWRSKYDHSILQQKADESKLKSQIASLESRVNISEGRLSATREQAESAQEEASEWKRKYEVAVSEAKTALQRAAVAQERTNKKVQEREDALRAELANQLSEKEEEISRLSAKVSQTEIHATSLISRLEATEAKLKDHESDSLALKEEIRSLTDNLESIRSEVLSREKEVRILEQEKNHLQEKYLAECKKFDETDIRCKEAEREARRATELADVARAEAAAAQKDKGEAQRLAMERLALIERMERQVEALERDKAKMVEEIERLHQSERDAMSKVTLLENSVDEREKEIDEMLKRNNQQRSSTVQVLESLLATEREACAEANKRAEALSLQLQATQGKLDMLQQELASVQLNETVLDSKLKTSARRLRGEATESVHDMDIDDDNNGRRRKRSKSTTSPFKNNHTEDGGSVFIGEDTYTGSQQGTETEDYTKFTVQKLKQELTKHGFGAQLLQLKNPNKKDIIALYEKHVVGK